VSGKIAYRPVTSADLELVCRHRHEMFMASGRSEAVVAPMTAAFRPWLEPRLAAGDYFGWIAEQDGQAVGGLGMMVIDWPPHPSHPDQGARGYVLNVYVEPPQRGQGIARTLMEMAQAEGRQRRLAYMVLHATAMGRPLYEMMGWKAGSEMGLALDD
jgi:GNAT superfamily N-acetyltransferase